SGATRGEGAGRRRAAGSPSSPVFVADPVGEIHPQRNGAQPPRGVEPAPPACEKRRQLPMATLPRLALALVPLVAGACRSPRTTFPVDPGITFAAHRAGNGFVVDHTRSGETGSLDRRGRLDEP